MKTHIKVISILGGLAVATVFAFQNCAPGFDTSLTGPGFGTSTAASVGSGNGSGAGGSGSGSGTSATPVPSSYTLNLASKILNRMSAVTVDPLTPSTIYAVETESANVDVSVDSGATWTTYCKSSTASLQIKFSMSGTSRIALGAGSGGLQRLVNVAGGTCPVSKALLTSYDSFAFEVSKAGRAYFWEFGKPLYTSGDAGKTWQISTNAISSASTMSVNPTSVSFAQDPVAASDDLYAFTRTSVETATYTISSTAATRLNATTANSSSTLYVDQATAGKIYLVYGSSAYSSVDSGKTLVSIPSFTSMDSTGAVYATASGAVAGTIAVTKAPMAGGTFAAFATLPFAAVTNLQVVGSTVVAAGVNKIALSTDGGATFKLIGTYLDPASLPVVSFAGSGMQLYAATNDSIFGSSDGGATWSQKQDISATFPNAYDEVKLAVSPGDVNRVYARAERYNSTYTYGFLGTTDGFATMTDVAASTGFSEIAYSWAASLALSADPQVAQMFSYNQSYHSFSDDIGWSMKAGGTGADWFVWYPWAQSFVEPNDSTKTLYGSSTTLYEYSFTTNVATSVNSRLPFTDPVAMDMKVVTPMSGTTPAVTKIWVLSSAGKIAESSDGGQTFTLQGSGAFATQSNADTPASIYSSDASGSEFLIMSGDSAATSKNGGASWTTANISGCQSRDAVYSGGKWLVACASGGPRVISQ